MSAPKEELARNADELDAMTGAAEPDTTPAPGQSLGDPLQVFQPANQPPGPHGQSLSSVE